MMSQVDKAPQGMLLRVKFTIPDKVLNQQILRWHFFIAIHTVLSPLNSKQICRDFLIPLFERKITTLVLGYHHALISINMKKISIFKMICIHLTENPLCDFKKRISSYTQDDWRGLWHFLRTLLIWADSMLETHRQVASQRGVVTDRRAIQKTN